MNEKLEAIQSPAAQLIAVGLEQGRDVEAMKPLYEIYKEERIEERRVLFEKAMGVFSSEVPVIEKSKKAYASNYAGLDDIIRAIKPALTKAELNVRFKVVSQTPDFVTMECRVGHAEGYSESTPMGIPVDADMAGANPAQKVASAVSYAKRYALISALGLATTDDDDDDGAATGAATQAITGLTLLAVTSLVDAEKEDKILKHYQVERLVELTEKQGQNVIRKLNKA